MDRSSSSPLRPTNDASLVPSAVADGQASLVLKMTSWSTQRMPFLALVRDRIAAKLMVALRTLTGSPLKVTPQDDQSLRAQDVLSLMDEGTWLAEIKADDLEVAALLSVDRVAAYCIFGRMMGGREVELDPPSERRAPTSIEANLIERILREVMAALNHALEGLSAPLFRDCHSSDHPQHLAVEHPQQPMLMIPYAIECEGRVGRVTISLPHSLLKPMCDAHTHEQGRLQHQDPEWSQRLIQEFLHASVDLDIILEQSTMKLEHVMAWAEGMQLDLRATPESRVTIACGGMPLFSASVGYRGASVAACIEDILYEQGDLA